MKQEVFIQENQGNMPVFINIHFYHPRLISRTYSLRASEMLSTCRDYISKCSFLRLFQNYAFSYNKNIVRQQIPIAQALNLDQNPKDKTFTLQIKLLPFDQKTAKYHLKQVVQILYNPILYQIYEVFSIQQKKLLAQEVRERTLNMKSTILMPPQKFQLPSNIYNILDYNVANQLLQPQIKNIKPQMVHFISFSGYNPPPAAQKLDGSLFYLHLRVLESVDYHITASPQGFYFNQSKISYFNPSPVPGKSTFVNLLDLIKSVSQKFQQKLQKFMGQNQMDEADKIFMDAKAPNFSAWLQKCDYDHSWNSKKSMNHYLKQSFEGNSTDWNENFHMLEQHFTQQNTADMTRYDIQQKLYHQFQSAALEGASIIIDGKLAPLNPLQEKKKQIYIYSRIFFSLATETTFNHAQEKGEQAAPSASAINTDLINLNILHDLHIPDVNVLHMVIVNYRGFRVIAQAIIPGILSSDQTLCSQYGSIDDGKTIQTNPQFQKLMVQIAQKLHLDDNIHLLDGKGIKKRIAISPDIKGIMGSNSKKYILDLLRLSPRDMNYPQIENQTCVIRSQLIEQYKRVKYINKEDLIQKFPRLNVNIGTQVKYIPNQQTQKQQKSLQDIASFILSNAIPNLINSLKSNGSEYLTNCQGISKAFHLHGVNLRYLGVVHDRTELKENLNIQIFLQRVIVTKSLKHLFRLVMRQTNIMYMNTVLTHLLNCLFAKPTHINQLQKGTLKQSQQEMSKENKKKKKKANKIKELYSNTTELNSVSQTQNLIKVQQPVYMSMKPSQLWDIVKKISQARYKHKLCDNLIDFNEKGLFSLPYSKLATLQDLCKIIGLSLQQKNYNIIDEEAIQGNTAKHNYAFNSINYQNTSNNQISQSTTVIALPFNSKNIAQISATAKRMNIKVPNQQKMLKDAQQQTEKFKINQALKSYQSLIETYSLTFNIEGLCDIYTKTAKIFYILTQYQTALNRQLICLKLFQIGLRRHSYKTIQSYSKLGLYEMVIGNRAQALYFLHKSLFLMLVTFGQTYPDIMVTIANIARIYQQDKEIQNAQKCFLKAIDILKPSHFKYHINISFCYSCLASLHYESADYKRAIQYQAQAVELIGQMLPEHDSRLTDAKKILKKYIEMAQKGNIYTPQQVPIASGNTKQKQKLDRNKK